MFKKKIERKLTYKEYIAMRQGEEPVKVLFPSFNIFTAKALQLAKKVEQATKIVTKATEDIVYNKKSSRMNLLVFKIRMI